MVLRGDLLIKRGSFFTPTYASYLPAKIFDPVYSLSYALYFPLNPISSLSQL